MKQKYTRLAFLKYSYLSEVRRDVLLKLTQDFDKYHLSPKDGLPLKARITGELNKDFHRIMLDKLKSWVLKAKFELNLHFKVKYGLEDGLRLDGRILKGFQKKLYDLMHIKLRSFKIRK